MKTQLKITVVLSVCLGSFGPADAEEKELSRDQLPKAVLEAVEKAHPAAKELEYKEETFEGKAAYEVEYEENGKEYEFLYSADGALLQKEEEIDSHELPEAIVQAITKVHPKATIKEAEKITKPDGTVVGYEVEVQEGEKELELHLDASGQLLKAESD